MSRQDEGFSLLEATLSTTILAVGLLSLWGTIVYGSRSNLAAEQKKKAVDAAAARIEFLKAQPFSRLVEDYGAGNGTGADRFAVPALSSDTSVASGQILLYLDETNPTGEAGLGLPRDLNGDGDSTDDDVTGSYRLVPVKVVVSWEGSFGPQQVEVRTLLREEN